MLPRLVARILLAPLGFVCGLFAGVAMLAFMSSDELAAVARFPDEVMLLGYDMSVTTATLCFLLAPLMGAPAIVAILIAEMFSIRSWVYHAVAGAMTAVLPWSLTPSGFDAPMFNAGQILACGFVGGLTHWLIAGRSSGLAPPIEP
ncbi:MAG TPA: hypothetical protein VGC77_17605 [Rhodopseudomonas sp.]|uniref:Uncharacterized protein n=1 Tax=Hansschlegelia plantiphila TaxID=374655 RepID=A0A9W6J131_9HYPH|nr:hypothetical protein [Hansschlegelia plantiphila]GLK68865.1 hypothetical protein GCM10008179_25030 [Hansschlegelia plantiphila]